MLKSYKIIKVFSQYAVIHYMNITIKKIFEYWTKIDRNGNGSLSKDEYSCAIKESSIFSSVLTVDMEWNEFAQSFVNKYRDIISVENSNNEVMPYRKENSAQPQDWNWNIIDRVLRQDEVNATPFDINTKENSPINPSINFNTADGKYMLKHLSFDTQTFSQTSHEHLPEGFKPDEIIQKGFDPGCNIRKMGYTGKGITIAVIDSPILTEHEEIKSNLVGYEVMNNALVQQGEYTIANFHGQATSSIISGKKCGVAPDSKLVYFAQANDSNQSDGIQALKRILEINKNCQQDQKIRVVSMSWGLNPENKNYEEYINVLKELKASGVAVFVADFSMVDGSVHGQILNFGSLDKINQNGDPNDYSNYEGESGFGSPEQVLLFPAGDRTVASAMGETNYRHDSKSSTSWTVPSIAGVYTNALECADKYNINLTQELFWELGLETGQIIKNKNGEIIGTAIDGKALIDKITTIGESTKRDFGL